MTYQISCHVFQFGIGNGISGVRTVIRSNSWRYYADIQSDGFWNEKAWITL